MKKMPSKILCITLSNFGDAILTAPAVSRIKKTYPLSRIDVMADGLAADFFKNARAVDNVLPYPRAKTLSEKMRLVHALQRQNYDVVVDFKNSYLAFLLPTRAALRRFLCVPREKIHRLDFHLWRAGFNEEFTPEEVVFKRNDAAQDFARTTCAQGTFIVGIAAGAKSHTKRWNTRGFAQLSGALLRKGATIVFLGSAEDVPATQNIIDTVEADKKNIINLAGKTDVARLLALFDRFSMLISGDSALVHLASLKNIPTVAIFGPTDPRKYGPRARRASVVRYAIGCMPCEKALCYKNPPESICMRELSVEAVGEKVFSMIKAVKGGALHGR
jgi:ADP-heptose:LPS heptosyltransferase